MKFVLESGSGKYFEYFLALVNYFMGHETLF